MAFPPFRRVQVSSFDDVVRMQDNLGAAINKLNRIDISDGVRITGVVVDTADTQIEHKLGRQPLGWMITDLDKASTIYRTAWDSKLLTLRASNANTTVDIWIF